MKANNSFAIDFIIRISKHDKHSALIFARITVNGDRKEVSLKEKEQLTDQEKYRYLRAV